MKREIKFRAWNAKREYMAYQGEPDLETLQSFIFHYGDCELMQFTGLYDKNGKEIFESDLVKINWTTYNNRGYFQSDDIYNEHEEITTVTYKYLSFGFDLKNGKRCQFGKNATIEIIGNIYENPEHL